jgi:hypothetical protein
MLWWVQPGQVAFVDTCAAFDAACGTPAHWTVKAADVGDQLGANIVDGGQALRPVKETEQQSSSNLQRRKRRKKEAAGHDSADTAQQEAQAVLDARHPGNERNRAAQRVVAAAWAAYCSWATSGGDSTKLQPICCHHHGRQCLALGAAHTAHDQPQLGTSPKPPQPVLQQALQQRQQGPVAAPQHTQPVDWAALYALRAVVRPKLRLMSHSAPPCTSRQHSPTTDSPPPSCLSPSSQTDTQTQSAVNLFGCLIRNQEQTPVIAAAHDTHVVLPPHSSLLLTDLSAKHALQLLLAGVCMACGVETGAERRNNLRGCCKLRWLWWGWSWKGFGHLLGCFNSNASDMCYKSSWGVGGHGLRHSDCAGKQAATWPLQSIEHVMQTSSLPP